MIWRKLNLEEVCRLLVSKAKRAAACCFPLLCCTFPELTIRLPRRCSPARVGGSTPCTGPLCSADPVVGVVVHRAREGRGEERERERGSRMSKQR